MTTPHARRSAQFSLPTSSVSAPLPSHYVALAQDAAKTAEIVEKLPAVCYPDDGAILPLLQEAGVHSFFVNVRSLIEFLEIHPQRKDRSASNLLPPWTPSVDQATRTRLNEYWRIGSQHLMHFGQVRTKQEDGTVQRVDVEKADLQAIADDVLKVWDDFSEQVDKANLMFARAVPKRGSFRVWNADGSSRVPAAGQPANLESDLFKRLSRFCARIFRGRSRTVPRLISPRRLRAGHRSRRRGRRPPFAPNWPYLPSLGRRRNSMLAAMRKSLRPLRFAL